MSDTFDHASDAFERMMDGEVDERPRLITCKHCGEGPFTWKNTPRGWRLQNKKGETHSCLLMAT